MQPHSADDTVFNQSASLSCRFDRLRLL